MDACDALCKMTQDEREATLRARPKGTVGHEYVNNVYTGKAPAPPPPKAPPKGKAPAATGEGAVLGASPIAANVPVARVKPVPYKPTGKIDSFFKMLEELMEERNEKIDWNRQVQPDEEALRSSLEDVDGIAIDQDYDFNIHGIKVQADKTVRKPLDKHNHAWVPCFMFEFPVDETYGKRPPSNPEDILPELRWQLAKYIDRYLRICMAIFNQRQMQRFCNFDNMAKVEAITRTFTSNGFHVNPFLTAWLMLSEHRRP